MEFGKVRADSLVHPFVFSTLVVISVVVLKAVVIAVKHTHSRGHNLLGTDTRKQSYVELPVEALRQEYRLYGLANRRQIALLLLLLVVHALRVGEVAQRPHNDRCHENDATHLLQILLALLPSMAA